MVQLPEREGSESGLWTGFWWPNIARSLRLSRMTDITNESDGSSSTKPNPADDPDCLQV